jgi:hypothetical protein
LCVQVNEVASVSSFQFLRITIHDPSHSAAYNNVGKTASLSNWSNRYSKYHALSQLLWNNAVL